MGLQFTCDKCGKRFVSNAFSMTDGRVQFSGNTVSCPSPLCDGTGHHKPGVYEFTHGILTAFTSTGMTREEVEAVSELAQKASSGALTSEEALRELRSISSGLAALVEKTSGSRIDWGLLVTLFLAIYTIWMDQKSDDAAQATLKETRTQTEIAQKMLEESQAQGASLRELATKQALPQEVRAQTSASKNRHQRLKERSIQRRTGRKPG